MASVHSISSDLADGGLRDATLITGLKRDNALLDRIADAANADVTVFDVSIETNRSALDRLLARGCTVTWFDHHRWRSKPTHARFRGHLDAGLDACTSSIVDAHLQGRFRQWAIVGLYGDEVASGAEALASSLDLGDEIRAALRKMGELINYNAYGATEDDPMLPPLELAKQAFAYETPLAWMGESDLFNALAAARRCDLERAVRAERWRDNVVVLPDERWARRVIGTLANQLARAEPTRPHAVLRCTEADRYVVSVRAPRVGGRGAGDLCERFPTGGGRAAAGGINVLAESDLPAFLEAFDRHWP